jgi:salicylate hydroxylase
MGGLATSLALAKQGFRQIDVYESASNLGFVGAGIQLAPNMARILDRLGVWKDIEAEAVDLKETSIRRSYCSKYAKSAVQADQKDRGIDKRTAGSC